MLIVYLIGNQLWKSSRPICRGSSSQSVHRTVATRRFSATIPQVISPTMDLLDEPFYLIFFFFKFNFFLIGYCWCVDEDSGKPIPGTSVKDPNPQCDAVQPPPRPMKGTYIYSLYLHVYTYIPYIGTYNVHIYIFGISACLIFRLNASEEWSVQTLHSEGQRNEIPNA